MKGDFAKIVRASNNQQVLVFYEPDSESADDDFVAHCMTAMDFGTADIKTYTTNEEAARRYVEGFGKDNADRFIQFIEKQTRGISNEQTKSEEA